MTIAHLASRRVRVPESFAAMQDYLWEQGWTDGLPVVPPTEDAVRGMLAAIDADPQHSLGTMQPRNSRASLEKLAINAVMAGCKPEHFPVVVAAVRAALVEAHNLAGTAATTGGANQVVIVNGPVANPAGHQRRRRLLRPRVPGQRRHRTRPAAHRPQRSRVDPGRDGQSHAQLAGPLQLLLRRERGPQPLGAVARGAGLCARRQHRQHRRHPRRLPHHGEHIGNRLRRSRHHRRQHENRGHCQLLPAGHRRAGDPGPLPRARRRDRRLRP